MRDSYRNVIGFTRSKVLAEKWGAEEGTPEKNLKNENETLYTVTVTNFLDPIKGTMRSIEEVEEHWL